MSPTSLPGVSTYITLKHQVMELICFAFSLCCIRTYIQSWRLEIKAQ